MSESVSAPAASAGAPAAHCPDPRLLEALAQHGRDAVSFQSVESGMRVWRDDAGPDPAAAGRRASGATGAVVSYVNTGSAWVAAGSPLCPPEQAARAAARFVAAARAAGRRASFFAVERPTDLGTDMGVLFLGEQPMFRPRRWIDELAHRRRLREQLRRARAKGVRVRTVAAAEVAPGTPLRAAALRLASEWLATRRMEPMGFLVAVEPFHAAEQHRYVAAEKDGRLIAFLSAVPIPARGGWLVEDVLRSPLAPNGTAESLLDAFMRQVEGAEMVTLGLAPLTGPIAPWQRLARFLSRPLYDFRGVRAFKERLRPGGWDQVYMCYPRTAPAALHLVNALRAFAGGPLWRFGLRSTVRHPGGPPWVLAMPLVPWTAILALRAALGSSPLLGWSRPLLAAWAGFDALLCLALFQVALRPSARSLLVAGLAAAADAALSVHHLWSTGIGHTPLVALFRALATLAPVVGTAGLLWAASRARAAARALAHARRGASGP